MAPHRRSGRRRARRRTRRSSPLVLSMVDRRVGAGEEDRLATVLPAHAEPLVARLAEHVEDLAEPGVVADLVPADLHDISYLRVLQGLCHHVSPPLVVLDAS